MKKVLVCVLFFLIFSCKKEEKVISVERIEKTVKKMTVKSSAFAYGDFIPIKYTCEGEDISPDISWSKIEGAKSYCLIVDDPDAPFKRWIHWIVFNIPASITSLPEGASEEYLKKIGAKQGLNDFKKLTYGGPCPPSGIHRYFFKVYALNRMIDLPEGIAENELMENIKNSIIGKGELMGKYKRRVG